MPAFAFVSGFFSKSFHEKVSFGINKIVGFLLLFVLFYAASFTLNSIFWYGKVNYYNMNIVNVPGAHWYLLCLAYWYVLIPYYKRVKHVVGITISIATGLIIGLFTEIDASFSLSRCFVFFPFFLCGYYSSLNRFRARNKGTTILAFVVLVAVLIALFIFEDMLQPFFSVIYGEKGYHLWIDSNIHGMIVRMSWYILAFIMVASILYICPRKRIAFTIIGERTLGIYIFHHLIRESVTNIGLHDYLPDGLLCILVLTAISVIVIVVTMQKPFTTICSMAFKVKLTF